MDFVLALFPAGSGLGQSRIQLRSAPLAKLSRLA